MSPLLWLLRRSFRNWIARKLTRLKEPKYAFSAIFLALYLCLMLAPYAAGFANPDSAHDLGVARAIGELLITGIVLVSFEWAWLWSAQGALAFSMAEASFLFPAPVSRRALLGMKILRTQLPILGSAVFFSFMRGSIGVRGFAAVVSNILIFEAMFLNRLVAALAQVPRPETGKPGPTALVGKALAALVLVAIVASFRPAPFTDPSSVFASLADWADRAPARFALAPFRCFVAPLFADTPLALARALVAPGVLVLGLLAVVLGSSVPFEEVALGASESLKERIEHVRRTGKLRPGKGKVRPAPVPLPDDAGPVLALAWKNYLGISRLPLWRAALYLLIALGAAAAIPRVPELRSLAMPVAMIAAWGVFMTTLIGPDTLRSDLRVSLRQADLVKTLPVAGWKVFLGEVLAGPLVLLALQAGGLAVALVAAQRELAGFSPLALALGWVGALVLLFPLDLLVFTVANGAAVLFPQWVQLGKQQERGAEALGQNFLVSIVRYLVLGVGLLPALFVGAVVAFVASAFLGPVAMPLGAAAAAAIMLAECAGLIWYLGGALERMDPSEM